MKIPNKSWLAAALAVLIAASPVTAFASGVDKYAPTLGGVFVEEQAVAIGDKLLVTGDAYDDESGVDSFTADFYNESTGDKLSVALMENADIDIEAMFAGRMKIPTDAAPGVYRLKRVTLVDYDGNRSRYNADGSGDGRLGQDASFEVRGISSNQAIKSVTFDETVTCADSSLTVNVEAGSGLPSIREISLTFRNAANDRKLFLRLKADDLDTVNEIYTAELKIPQYEPDGRYDLYEAAVTNMAGEKQVYSNAGKRDSEPLNVSASFKLESDGAGDDQAPRLSEVAIIGTREVEGDMEYHLKVQVSDNSSGVDYVLVRFRNSANERTVSKVLSVDEEDEDYEEGVVEGWLSVSATEPAGTFRLDRVTVVDKAKNRQVYVAASEAGGEKKALSKTPSFTLKTTATREDNTAPYLDSVSLSTTEANRSESEKITVRATAHDDLSGIKNIKLKFENTDGKTINVTLTEYLDKYESDIRSDSNSRYGIFHLVKAAVTDKAGNSRTYVNKADGKNEVLKQDVSFRIYAESED